MAQSKIIQYINNFPTRKQERFRQFVNSPYFNQHKKTKELLNIIIKQLKRKKPKIGKEDLFPQLFPNEPYDEQKLFNVMSYLKKMYQKFLACEYLEEHEEEMELLTLEGAFKDQSTKSILKNRAKHLEKKLQHEAQKDIQSYYKNYRINFLLGFHEEEYTGKNNQSTLQSMLDHFDQYYIAQKLKMCCLAHANTLDENVEYDFSFLTELIDFIEVNWPRFKQNIHIRLYYNVYMSQKKNSEKYYKELMEIFNQEFDQLSKDDQKHLYDAARNFCVRQINVGNADYREVLFGMYQEGEKNKMLMTKGTISEWEYKNIVTLGCFLKEFDYVERFLEENRQYLPSDKKDNAYSFNRANLFFYKKQYEKVLETLMHVHFSDVKYHINGTVLLLRTYYKMGDTEALLSSIETFRIFIIRNKDMATSKKRGYTNFLRFKKKLVLLKHNAPYHSKENFNTKMDKLRQEIEETEQLFNKSWLLQECKVGT